MSLANRMLPDTSQHSEGARNVIARVRLHWARMGITRVADVTGLDRIGIPVVMVCRPNARSLAVSEAVELWSLWFF